jgi:hypothetical protein
MTTTQIAINMTITFMKSVYAVTIIALFVTAWIYSAPELVSENLPYVLLVAAGKEGGKALVGYAQAKHK